MLALEPGWACLDLRVLTVWLRAGSGLVTHLVEGTRKATAGYLCNEEASALMKEEVMLKMLPLAALVAAISLSPAYAAGANALKLT